MSQQELVKFVVRALTNAGIHYMLTGSTVSSIQGVWRATHGIDIVVSLNTSNIKAITDEFPEPNFYSSDEAIRDAIKRQRMFNGLDTVEGGKLDFWILTNTPFDRSRFARRISKRYSDMDVLVSTPEDTIIAKLRWAKECGESEKQFVDALRVYEIQHGILDIAYLERWVAILGLERFWKRLLAEARVV